MGGKLIDYYIGGNDDKWKSLPDANAFLEYVNPINGYEISAKSCEITHRSLPFYSDIEIIRLQADKWAQTGEEVIFFFLRQGSNVVFLSGLSQYIYEANSWSGIQINESNCAEYLKFFCFFLQTDDGGGPFYIIEGHDSEFIRAYSQMNKDRVLKNYEGLKIKPSDGPGIFSISARVIYSNNIYDADFEVYADGRVLMSDDMHLCIS